MTSRGDIPLSGTFNCWRGELDLPDVLLAVCRTGKTGELRFKSSEAEKKLIIHSGNVAFATSSSADDRLGPFLLRTAKLRFEHLMELSRFVSPQKRFGTVLVENGVLDPKELVQGVVGQVRSIVMSLFRWTEAEYAFEEKELPKETITLRVPVAKLVVDGVREVTSWRRVIAGIGSLDAVYQTNLGVEDAISAAHLNSEEAELVSELRGPKTISEACAATELGDFEVCQLLWAFHSLGWVAPVTEIAPSAPQPSPPAPAENKEDGAVRVIQAESAEPTGDADLDGLGMVLSDDPLEK